MKFIDRASELATLEACWRQRGARFLVCYGRRRVGKTEVIKTFLRNRPGIYFLADRLAERENLRALTRLVRGHYEDSFLGDFSSWYDFFDYLAAKKARKMVLVIDEFPYLVETNRAISSVFQKGWDETLQKLPIMLVLCGSSIGMMERETLVYGAPLYGRRTAQLRIYPFTFTDFSLFFPRPSFDRRLQLYTMVGGIPAYIRQLDGQLRARENFIRKFLPSDAYLFHDADFILKEETREPRQYFSILRAMALGKHKFGEIVNETGIEKTSLHRYLYFLQELSIIEKRVPVTDHPEKSRRGLYYLSDRYFEFWFDMVFQYRSELVLANLTSALARFDQSFQHHVAAAYEEVGCEILRRYQDRFFPFSRLGKWWDRNNEIDIVGLASGGEDILLAEVKWSSKKVGVNVYSKLREKAELVSRADMRRRYALISRSGFTAGMKKLAKEDSVVLIQGERIV